MQKWGKGITAKNHFILVVLGNRSFPLYLTEVKFHFDLIEKTGYEKIRMRKSE
ncbi:hypothetical protein B4102_0269 [Heyndrickxia sporothermodurans]|uniref:Uncharacterized protein n=1 Tax=Heyndrickxia sporothermodurans TaxID=46224 RepID=A0A150KS88_9BACI|nr:hypothetical protein B4102_0269 [Heyndrickxia sporothermodurans]